MWGLQYIIKRIPINQTVFHGKYPKVYFVVQVVIFMGWGSKSGYTLNLLCFDFAVWLFCAIYALFLSTWKFRPKENIENLKGETGATKPKTAAWKNLGNESNSTKHAFRSKILPWNLF